MPREAIELASLMKSEYARWGDVVRKTGAAVN
jgi:hypothetical protein